MSEDSEPKIEKLLQELRKGHKVTHFVESRKRNIYILDNTDIIYLTYSKIHFQANPPRYFFGISKGITDILKKSDNTYVLLICGEIENYFLIEFKKINSILLHKSTAQDGYWKIHITDKFELKEGSNFNLSSYKDRYGLFGQAGVPKDDDINKIDEDDIKRRKENLINLWKSMPK
ncbi:MAG: hypothetical protein KKC75_04625 [Nanoarchaeota archaeon]|nr:hypothetical protein [Nanoarchaeota archaeon]MBU1005097.1 hypothetical protein [Nanoarchaeota archaeon]MBU1945883.1 hypothetical protein [Nanoarchaeota archaeon]